MSEARSVGDVHANAFLSAVQDNLDPVRAMIRNRDTGELFEIVGIRREGGDVVPLFLVPIGGAPTILDKYEVVNDNPLEANPFDEAAYIEARSNNLH